MRMFIIICLVLSSLNLKAEGLYEFIERKQAQKKQSRWTLAEWLALKERNGLMDQWLALNTAPNIMDFNLSVTTSDVDHTLNNVKDSVVEELKAASLALHFNIFGLEGQYQQAERNSSEQYKSRTGIFHFRILGQSTQSTHIALIYGVHLLNDTGNGKYDYEFPGVSANFYFLSFLGAEGSYRNYNKTKNDGLTSESWGRRVEYGLFLELGFVRLFATQFKQTLVFKNSTTENTEIDEGTLAGLKLFF